MPQWLEETKAIDAAVYAAIAELARRHVPMPRSSSFPSGHAASAFAFATGAEIASRPARPSGASGLLKQTRSALRLRGSRCREPAA